MTDKIEENDIRLLIPWYLNGSLSEEENKKVEEFLTEHPSSNEEIETYNLIRSAVGKADEMIAEEASPQFAAMEESIMQRIDSPSELSHSVETEAKESIMDKISRLLPSFTFPAMNPVPIAAILLIQFALIIGLITKLYFEEADQYTTLSGSESVEITGPKIIVAFENTASEKDIRDILLDINAKIIDGPKANGIYILAIDDSGNNVVVENVIEKLRSKKNVVKLAEEAY